MEERTTGHRIRTLAWALLGTAFGVFLLPSHRAMLLPGPPKALDLARLQALSEDYHLALVTSGEEFPVVDQTGSIRGYSAEPEDLAKYQPILDAELRLYPRELPNAIGLRRIVLCADLSYSGSFVRGLSVWPHGALYLDAGDASSRSGAWILHHEIYHMIDYFDGGLESSDAAWEVLNPPGFHYVNGILPTQPPALRSAGPCKPGIVSRNALVGVQEDKAEVYAMMMTTPRQLAAWAGADTVLAAKVRLLKRRLEHLGCGLDSEFVRRVEAYRDEHPVVVDWLR